MVAIPWVLPKRDAEAGAVEHKIVRVTKRFTPHAQVPSWEHLQVVATYLARGQIVTLERYVGILYRKDFEGRDKPVWEKAEEIHSQIEGLAKELGLEVHPGVLLDWEPPT
jgi:hypothetical protein